MANRAWASNLGASNLAASILAASILAAAAVGLCGCGQVSGLETEARILAEPPCTDFFFPVYFPDRSPELTPAARRVVRNAGRHAQGCTLAKVEVVGLADYRAADGAAPPLSRERARRLAEALSAAGLPQPDFHASPLGDTTAAPVPAPLRRRMDVFVRFAH